MAQTLVLMRPDHRPAVIDWCHIDDRGTTYCVDGWVRTLRAGQQIIVGAGRELVRWRSGGRIEAVR